MKKLLLYFILLISIFTIVGCGSKNEEVKKDNEEKEVDKSIVKVNGVELHINKDKEFKGIKYTITDDLKEAIYDQYIQYNLYQDDGTNLLFFRIFYYEKKDHDYIRKDLAIDSNLEEVKGKNNYVEYSFIDTKRTDGTMHFYIIDKDNISYVINFVSKNDINDFEKVVLNSIKL